MKQKSPVDPGKVDWSGENPGIYVKDTADGPYRSLALFFRVVLSPHGRGTAMLIVGDPDRAEGWPEANNFMIADNHALARYLVDGFVVNFPAFRGKPGLQAATFLPLTKSDIAGDAQSRYVELVASGDLAATMTWEKFGDPFAVHVSREQSATGTHEMYSIFVEAKDAAIAVNGRELPGRVMSRQMFGKTMSTAFLAFSETWVTPVAAPTAKKARAAPKRGKPARRKPPAKKRR